MIQHFRYGTPFETGAVVKALPVEETNCEYETRTSEGETWFRLFMEPEDLVYGLGENVRGMNKRGWHYESYATDNPNHQEDTTALYGGHNFLLVAKKDTNIGIFIDYPGRVRFDVGYTQSEILDICVCGEDFHLYILEEADKKALVKEFRELIGTSYIPPKWGFGVGQSRWSYPTQADVLEVAKQYKENGFPLDSIYLDIDYMDNLKDFTVSRERFPDLEGLQKKLGEDAIHLVPIIDAGVKIEKGYAVYEEGVAGDYFCKDADGKDFVAAVWPGKTHFPDMLNPEAAAWFGEKYKVLLDQGIDGFWNDMNEPAIFYTEEGMKRLHDAYEEIRSKDNLDLRDWFAFLGKVNSVTNNVEDYKSFYHKVNGNLICHDKVHNLFGMYMTKAASDAFERLCPDKRILMYSRSSYVGMHRFGGIWTGDNKSWWSHLLMNLQMLPALNMVGFLYTGADIGGFGSDTTEDLLMRWIALGVFTPLMRNHATMGSRVQEPYRFAKKEEIRGLLQARYRMLPYLYSEFMKCAKEGDMLFKPLSFEYAQDRVAAHVEDQLLVGESIMIAPVYVQNAIGRTVYLPEPMQLIRLGKNEELNGTVYEAGWHFIEVPLEDIPVFIRPGHLLVLGNPADNVEGLSDDKLLVKGFLASNAFYDYYNDDGYTKQTDYDSHMTRIYGEQA